jgi:hypothetical protein
MALPTALETLEPRRERIPELQDSVQPLPAFAEALVPGPVKEASRELAERRAHIEAARAAVEEARAAVNAAWAADQAAAKTAAEAGKAPPKPTEPKAKEALAEVERQVPAAEALAREAQHRFVAAWNDNREATAAAAREAAQVRIANETERVREMEARLLEACDAEAVAAAAAEPIEGRFMLLSFAPGRRLPDEYAGLGAVRAALEDRLEG